MVGGVMGQVASDWPVTVEVWVQSLCAPLGIYGGQSDSGTGTGFFPSSLVFHCKYYLLYILIVTLVTLDLSDTLYNAYQKSKYCTIITLLSVFCNEQ